MSNQCSATREHEYGPEIWQVGCWFEPGHDGLHWDKHFDVRWLQVARTETLEDMRCPDGA